LIRDTVALLLPLVLACRQALGLPGQRLLVDTGEEQVSVLVPDAVLGSDLETQSVAARLLRLALKLRDPVGHLLGLRLLRLLDLGEPLRGRRVLLRALLLLAGLLLPEVHRFGGLRLVVGLLLVGSLGLRYGGLGGVDLLLGHAVSSRFGLDPAVAAGLVSGTPSRRARGHARRRRWCGSKACTASPAPAGPRTRAWPDSCNGHGTRTRRSPRCRRRRGRSACRRTRSWFPPRRAATRPQKGPL